MRKPTASYDKKVNTEKTDETLHQPNYYHLDSFSGSRIQLEQSISRQPPGCRRPCQTQPAHSCSHRQQSHENNKEKRSPEEGRKKKIQVYPELFLCLGLKMQAHAQNEMMKNETYPTEYQWMT